jgi:hypothetical protein
MDRHPIPSNDDYSEVVDSIQYTLWRPQGPVAILVVNEGPVRIAGGAVSDDFAAFVLHPDAKDAFELPQHLFCRKRLALIELGDKN